MTEWEKSFRKHCGEMTMHQLTHTIDYCYKMSNALSGANWTPQKDYERGIWKKKAKIAIEMRNKL